MKTLKLSDIRTDGGTQPRAAINFVVVGEYAEFIQNGVALPPVVVFYDGDSYWLADGFHRVKAAAQAGKREIEVDIHQGSQRDAILYSVGANASHGLRRTNEDKRRAVMRLLKDAEWGTWSDRKIARRCEVSHQTVTNYRNELSVKSLQIERPVKRTVTRNGTSYQMNTRNIGGKHKPKHATLHDTPKPDTASKPQSNFADALLRNMQQEKVEQYADHLRKGEDPAEHMSDFDLKRLGHSTPEPAYEPSAQKQIVEQVNILTRNLQTAHEDGGILSPETMRWIARKLQNAASQLLEAAHEDLSA